MVDLSLRQRLEAAQQFQKHDARAEGQGKKQADAGRTQPAKFGSGAHFAECEREKSHTGCQGGIPAGLKDLAKHRTEGVVAGVSGTQGSLQGRAHVDEQGQMNSREQRKQGGGEWADVRIH